MRVSPARRPAKPPTRWKRVLLVTLIVTVPRCASRRRNVRALRSTDRTVPSNWRGAACRGAGGGGLGGGGGGGAARRSGARVGGGGGGGGGVLLLLLAPRLGGVFWGGGG